MSVFSQTQYLPDTLLQIFVNDDAEQRMAIVDFMHLRNNGSSASKATLYIVPNGGTADVTNKLFEETLSPDEGMAGEGIVGADLGPGDSLWGIQSVASTIVMRATGRYRS